MSYQSPNPSHEKMVWLKEKEVRDIATGSHFEWYIVTVIIFFICAFVGFVLAFYFAQLLAGVKI